MKNILKSIFVIFVLSNLCAFNVFSSEETNKLLSNDWSFKDLQENLIEPHCKEDTRFTLRFVPHVIQ